MLVERVSQFKYMGITMDYVEEEWTEIRQNIKRSWKFWGQLGKMLQRKGSDIHVLEMFYRLMIKVVLILKSDLWIHLEAIARTT